MLVVLFEGIAPKCQCHSGTVGGPFADRLANPTATVRPEKILSPARAAAFLDVESRVDRVAQEGKLPRSCYFVPPENEVELQRLLLSAGMAAIISEDCIARTAGGQVAPRGALLRDA